MTTKKEIIIEGIQEMLQAFKVAPGIMLIINAQLISKIKSAPNFAIAEAARIINKTSDKLRIHE